MSKFGIKKETKSGNNVKMFPPQKLEKATAVYPSGWKFPISTLVNVIADPKFDTKNGESSVIKFFFVDKEKRVHQHIEFAVDADDAKFDKKKDGLDVRIKHIFVEIFGEKAFPDNGIGTEANSWDEFFAAVEKTFNSITIKVEGEDKPIKAYTTVKIFTKLTYYKGNLGFPLSPNFVQRVQKEKPCKLDVNLAYDTVEQESRDSRPAIPGSNGGDDVQEFSSFENEFE